MAPAQPVSVDGSLPSRVVGQSGAHVWLSGTRPGGVGLTDNAGRYEITGLSPGTIAISAAKGGFLAASYGQTRWPGSGTSLTLREAERLERIDITMPRGGVVSGQVFDEAGEPLVGVVVRAARVVWLNGEPRAASGGSDTTDDRGQYRVYGLTPGTYSVSATGRAGPGAPLTAEGESGGQDLAMPAGYAPTYYPSAVSVADAGAVRVKAGQETLGIDVAVRLVSMAEVSGIWSNPEVLEQLRETASLVTIAEGETKSIALLVSRR